MIRHALAEGWLLLRHRWEVSSALSLALAIPIGLAGVTWSLMHWLEPVADLADQVAVVPVLLHPHMDPDQRRQWIEEQREMHPDWGIEEIASDRLAERLTRWFPYLEDLLQDGGSSMLSPLVEITTANLDSVGALERSPAVLAVGPRSSVQQSLGKAARALGWGLGLTSSVLLVAAALFTAVWVHLELYRHADELAIMRLIGATESAIRGPFLVASSVPGIVASVLAVAGSVVVVTRLSTVAMALGLPPLQVAPAVLVVELVLACGLPLVAALVTLARRAMVDVEG